MKKQKRAIWYNITTHIQEAGKYVRFPGKSLSCQREVEGMLETVLECSHGIRQAQKEPNDQFNWIYKS